MSALRAALERYHAICSIRLLWRVGAISIPEPETGRTVARMCIETAQASRAVERALGDSGPRLVRPLQLAQAQADGHP